MNHETKTNFKLTLIATFLLVAVAALYGFGLGNYGLFNTSEAYTAQVSAEMLEKGAMSMPTFNGVKQDGVFPLAHMIQVASYKMFEVSPFAARLPFAIIGFLLVLVTYNSLILLTQHKRFALIAAAVTGLNVPVVIFAKTGIADGFFWFLTLSATFLLIGSVFDLKRNYVRVMIAGFLASGAMLTGGAVGFVVPLVIGLIVALVRHQPGHNLAQLSPLTYTFASFLGTFPWVVGFYKSNGLESTISYVLQLAHHSIPNGVAQGLIHPEQLAYYFVGFFPWALFLPAALMYHFRFAPRRLTAPEARVAMPAICYVWLVLTFGVFLFLEVSLSTLFYATLVPTAVLISDFIDRLPEKPLKAWHALYILPLCLIGAGALMLTPQLIEAAMGEGPLQAVLPYFNSISAWSFPIPSEGLLHDMLSQPVDWGMYPVLVGALLLVGTLVGAFIMRHGGHEAALFVGGGVLMAIVIGTWGGFPRVYEYREQPLHWITTKINKEHNIKNDHTIVYGTEVLPSVRFEVPGIVSYMNNPILALRAPGRTLYVITDTNNVESLKEHLPKGVKPECVGGYCFTELFRYH